MDFTIAEYAWIRTAAHWYGERYDTRTIRTMLQQRDPDITPQRSSEIAKAARQSLQISREFERAYVNTPLAELCPQCERPSPMVSVSLLYSYRKPDGSVRENTMKVLTNWQASVADVIGEGNAMLEEITGQYGTIEVTSVRVYGGIYTPADEQL